MRYSVKVGDRTLVIALDDNGPQRRVTLDGRELLVDWRPVGASSLAAEAASAGEPTRAGHYSMLIGEHSYEAYIRPLPNEDTGAARAFEVSFGPTIYEVTLQDERAQALASLTGGAHGAGDATIRAPMPGLVGQVLVEEGATVERGQALIVLEAMKMENDLTTPRAGVVKSVRVSKGQTVNQGEALIVVGESTNAEQSASEDDEDETSI